MQLAVMDPADRDGELVADSLSKGARLCKREVVRIRRHSTTHKAWLPSHEFAVVLIAGSRDPKSVHSQVAAASSHGAARE